MRKLMISMLLVSGLAFAQGPMGWRRGPAMRGPMPRQAMAQRPLHGVAGVQALKDYLGLTDAQMEQIRTLRREQVQEVRPESQAVRAKAQELRKEMQASNPDAAKVGQLTVELKQLREKALAERLGFSDKARAVLTADQQAKLKALEEAAKLGTAARQAAAVGLITPPLPAALEEGQLPPAPRLRPGFQPRPMMRGRVPDRGPVRF